jgi:putative membrane protein
MNPPLLLGHVARLGHSPWDFHLHPDVLVVMSIAAVGYVMASRRYAPSPDVTPSRRNRWCFWTGLGLLWLFSEWPIHDLAEGVSYAVHMVQHLAMTFVVPPLLLLGIPSWMARAVLRPVLPIVRFAARPLIALLLFNGIVVLTHWPLMVTAAVDSGGAHLAQHVLLVVSAMVMFLPVLSPLPEIPRLPPLFAMVYVFAQSLIPTVPASWLTFADHPPYHAYEPFPKLWGLTAGEDQQLAGGVMKVGGAMILWSYIVAIFFRWAAREGSGRSPHRRPGLAQDTDTKAVPTLR